MSQSIQSISLQTHSGDKIQAYWFTPENQAIDAVKGKIVIASAMGVEQIFYRPIATWLAEQGYAVLTFDCRGIGESATRPLQDYECNIVDWAKDDYSIALDFVVQRPIDHTEAQLPLYWIGHSLGGQVFPLVKNIQQVSKIITFASGTGYWKKNAVKLRKKAPLFWFLIVPILTSLYGYFPGKKLGVVGNLPKGVMLQWRRWCLHPRYCVGAEPNNFEQQFNQLTTPLHSIYFTDDEMLSTKNIQDLYNLFSHESKTLTEVTPAHEGVDRIGHLGFFKEQFEDSLWPKILLPELNEP